MATWRVEDFRVSSLTCAACESPRIGGMTLPVLSRPSLFGD